MSCTDLQIHITHRDCHNIMLWVGEKRSVIYLFLVGTQQSIANCIDFNIKIGNERIPQANKSKHLGMQVENTLRWNAHIDQLVKKLPSKIGILRRL